MARRSDKSPNWTREGVKQRLLARFWTRFHMSLILLSCGLAAMLANKLLRVMGVDAMLVRYPIAVAVSYLTFLAGIWVWLRYAGLHDAIHGAEQRRKLVRERQDKRSFDASSLPDVTADITWESPGVFTRGSGDVVSGGGGAFDGGGASASWADGGSNKLTSLPSLAKGSSSGSSGFDLGDLGDGDAGGFLLVVLALLVIAVILFSSGYLIWIAPDILTEAAFGALLAGGLARPAKREDAAGWMAGVMKKTWWPFAIVFVLSLAIAGFVSSEYPKARTFSEALEMAGKPPQP